MSDKQNLISNIAGHGVGFPAGAITLFSSLSSSFLDSPLKSIFAVASLAVGAICVRGATKASASLNVDYAPSEVATGVITGALLGAFVMGGTAVVEKMVEPAKQRAIQYYFQEESASTPPQIPKEHSVCVMPPAVPGCGPNPAP